jgi:hypothetical protein
MTITDFSLLTTTEKLHILYTEGVYLAKRNIGSKSVILYQYQKLYIEIFYSRYRREVERIRCSEGMELLDPYLSAIPVATLINP